MSNTIKQDMESVSYQIHQQEKAQRRGDEQILTAQLKSKQLAHAKDVVIPAARGEEDTKAAQGKGKSGSTKPPLPTPTTSGLKFAGNDNDFSLIAIIGKVLALQAKTNSHFWKTLWTQASKTQLIQVKWAPIIGSAVKASADAQADASKNEAEMDKQTAIANLGGFVGSMALGGVVMGANSELTETGGAAFAEDSDVDEDAPPTKMENTETSGKYKVTYADDSTAEIEMNSEQAESMQNQIDETDADQARARVKNKKEAEKILKQRAKSKTETTKTRWQKTKGIIKRGYKNSQKYLMSAVQASQMTNQGTMVATGFIGAHFKSKIAVNKGDAGVQDALSKESEQYAQYYGQTFQREEEIRQGAQQNIDYAMNVLKGVVDTITQTVNSMFRG